MISSEDIMHLVCVEWANDILANIQHIICYKLIFSQYRPQTLNEQEFFSLQHLMFSAYISGIKSVLYICLKLHVSTIQHKVPWPRWCIRAGIWINVFLTVVTLYHQS